MHVWCESPTVSRTREALTSLQTLAPHLSVSALLEIADSRSTFKPRIFILAPPSTAIISSIHTLLRDRLKSLHLTTTLSAEPAAFELLDSVQVLQYLDLPGLAEALSEVSQRLFENGQIHATTDSGTGGSATENGPSGGSILLVQGLSTVLNSVQRRSGIVQTSAILSNLLRTIKHLSRIHHDLIVLVEADITTESPIAGERDLEAGQLDTAFSSATGTAMGVVPGGAVGSVIDRGTDVMVCVHDGFAMTTGDAKGKNRDGGHRSRTRVVEVVKDTMRGRLGEWCIWVQ